MSNHVFTLIKLPNKPYFMEFITKQDAIRKYDDIENWATYYIIEACESPSVSVYRDNVTGKRCVFEKFTGNYVFN